MGARKLKFEVLGNWGWEEGCDTIVNSQVQTKDDLDKEQKQECIITTTKAPIIQPAQVGLVRRELNTTTREEEKPDQAPSLEDREVPDHP